MASAVDASREVGLEAQVERTSFTYMVTANLSHSKSVENDDKVQIYGSEVKKVRVVYPGARPSRRTDGL